MMPELIKKPLPPSDNECCESGSCNPCVWDLYYDNLKKWRLEQVKLKEQQKSNTSK